MTRVTPPVPLGEPLEVGAHRGDVEEEPLQGRRDGGLADRLGQHAVADHQPLDPHREVARHRVDPRVEPGHRRDEHAEVDRRPGAPRGSPTPGATASAVAPTPGVRRDAAHRRARWTRRRSGARCRCCGGTPAGRRPTTSSLRRWARPSPSNSSAPSERASVGSSTKVSSGEAIVLADPLAERRPALDHRAAAEHAADDAEHRGGHAGLEHERDPLGRRLRGAEQARGAEHGVGGGLLDVEVAEVAADREAAGDLRLAVVHGEGLHGEVAACSPGPTARMPVLVATAPSPRPSLQIAVRTPVTRGSRPVVARSSSRARATFSSVGTDGQALAPEVELGRRHAVGLGEAVVLVGLGEGGVVAGLGQRVQDDALVERAGVGEALALVDDHADADARGAGLRERLDLALVGLDRGGRAPGDERLDLLAGAGHARRSGRRRRGARSAWPTAIRPCRRR